MCVDLCLNVSGNAALCVRGGKLEQYPDGTVEPWKDRSRVGRPLEVQFGGSSWQACGVPNGDSGDSIE